MPIIDGLPLFERLDDRASGIPFEWLWPPSGQWTGLPVEVEYDRAVVLDGTCGIAGCCGVVARIAIGAETVVSDDFYANDAPELPDGLRFEFSRPQYEARLAELGNLLPVDWVVANDA